MSSQSARARGERAQREEQRAKRQRGEISGECAFIPRRPHASHDSKEKFETMTRRRWHVLKSRASGTRMPSLNRWRVARENQEATSQQGHISAAASCAQCDSADGRGPHHIKKKRVRDDEENSEGNFKSVAAEEEGVSESIDSPDSLWRRLGR